jgi:hypothetical protein
MRTTILLAVLMLAFPAWSQAPAQRTPQGTAQDTEAKPKLKRSKAAKKATARRQQDARHCLQRSTNDAIIRCAEEYL